MSEMIERVARALLNAHFERGVGMHREWDSLGHYEKNMMYVGARAAIEAMREPTEYMLGEGHESGGIFWRDKSPGWVWLKMIDAASRETAKEPA